MKTAIATVSISGDLTEKLAAIASAGFDGIEIFENDFLAEQFGSAVQHLAFACEDIFSTAKLLQSSGFRPLQISANYYDDLAARFALDDAMLQSLRNQNILYDRDDGGEYFQLYSPNYRAGFFFEIVERRSDYKGYGAANAQFRIAAQKRTLPGRGMPGTPRS